MTFRKMDDEDFDKIVAEHDRHATMFAKEREEASRQFCWDAGIQIIKVLPEGYELPEYTIEISPVADRKIKALLRAYTHLEWLGYLVGAIDRDACIVKVEDLVIPKQMVTTASVYNVEYSWDEGKPIIGVIHSHHTMGAFFSGTDDSYINQNHDVSIVVATVPGREIKSQVRVKAPCGGYYITEKIKYVRPVDSFDEVEFEREFRSKIGQFTYTYGNGYRYGFGNGGGRVNHGGNFRRTGTAGSGSRNSTGEPLFPVALPGTRIGQTLTPQDFQRINGGNGNRCSNNHLVPSNSDVMSGTAERFFSGGYQTELEWDSQDEDYILDIDGLKDPHMMTEQELRAELLKYYSPEDVEDYIECDDAADELEEIYKEIRNGVHVSTVDEITEAEFDRESDGVEWVAGEGERSSTISQEELDDLERFRVFVH